MWASIPVLVIIGLLIGIFIVSVLDNSGNGRDVPAVDGRLDVTDCFILVGNTATERDCAAGTADGQVTGVVPDPGNCPTGQVPLPDPNSDFFLCWARLQPGSINTIPG